MFCFHKLVTFLVTLLNYLIYLIYFLAKYYNYYYFIILGMPHQEVARLIAESFAQTDKTEIEFLVVEAKKSNLEPKPTALIFLES